MASSTQKDLTLAKYSQGSKVISQELAKSHVEEKAFFGLSPFRATGSVELKLFLPRKKYLRLWKVRRESILNDFALEVF